MELECIHGKILFSEDLSKLLFDFLRCRSSQPRIPTCLLTAPSGRTAYATRCSAATSARQNPQQTSSLPPPKPLTHLQVVIQLLENSPVSCIRRIKQLDVVDGLIAYINNLDMCTIFPLPPVTFCNILHRLHILCRIATLDHDPSICMGPGELKWLADSTFVHRLVDLLHSPDADRQYHANVALTGLVRSSPYIWWPTNNDVTPLPPLQIRTPYLLSSSSLLACPCSNGPPSRKCFKAFRPAALPPPLHHSTSS
jgi:hypothetical protein